MAHCMPSQPYHPSWTMGWWLDNNATQERHWEAHKVYLTLTIYQAQQRWTMMKHVPPCPEQPPTLPMTPPLLWATACRVDKGWVHRDNWEADAPTPTVRWGWQWEGVMTLWAKGEGVGKKTTAPAPHLQASAHRVVCGCISAMMIFMGQGRWMGDKSPVPNTHCCKHLLAGWIGMAMSPPIDSHPTFTPPASLSSKAVVFCYLFSTC